MESINKVLLITRPMWSDYIIVIYTWCTGVVLCSKSWEWLPLSNIDSELLFHVEFIADTMISRCRGSVIPHCLSEDSVILDRELNVSQPCRASRSVYMGRPLSTMKSCTPVTLFCSGLRFVSADKATCEWDIKPYQHKLMCSLVCRLTWECDTVYHQSNNCACLTTILSYSTFICILTQWLPIVTMFEHSINC